MSEEDIENSSSLVLYASRELDARRAAENPIVSEMVESSLALARKSGIATLDLDALVREGVRLYRIGKGMTPENVRAFNLFRRAATAGNAEAQFFVSRCYGNGDGIRADSSVQVEWLLRSAEAGFADSQCDLGLLIYNAASEGVPNAEIADRINFVESVKWLRKAAERGVASAQYVLGLCYQEGKGVPIDLAESMKWLQKAAEQGHAEAQSNLAWCYVDSDKSEHVKWLNRAAEQGHYKAQLRLSIIHFVGYLPEEQQDIVQAYKWERILAETAADAEGAACALLNLSDKKKWMTLEQIERGEELAREFLAKRRPAV